MALPGICSTSFDNLEIPVRKIGWRQLKFASVGLTTMVVGYGLLIILVELSGTNESLAYLIQAFFSVELNFILNRYVTWRDRGEIRLISAWLRFHIVRAITIPLNQLLFNLLILAVPYWIAFPLTVVVVMIINYVTGDKFTFGTTSLPRKEERDPPVPLGSVSCVSVVIPCKHNANTILQTLNALLSQDAEQVQLEIILVGDIGDTTWRPIQHLLKQGLVIAYEVSVASPGRDANAKRAFGLRRATGQVLATLDSDVIVASHWLASVTELLKEWPAVAGPVTGLGNNLWVRYIDWNMFAPKTPRMDGGYVLNSTTLGNHKPPITANFACRSEVYDTVGGPNVAFTNSYEDYEWFSRVVRAGFSILCTDRLKTSRFHREGLKPLLREYRRSGKGCADHIVVHPSCPFAKKRIVQLLGVAVAFGVLTAVSIFYTYITVLVAVVMGCILGGVSWAKLRRFEAFAYPFISLLFATMFVAGILRRFGVRGWQAPAKSIITDVRSPIFATTGSY